MAEFKPNYEPEAGVASNLSQYCSPNGGIPSINATGYGSPNGVGAEYASPNSGAFDQSNWVSIWETADGANQPIESLAPMTVGVRFKTTVPGQIVGIRFRHAVNCPQEYVATLWSNTGTKLGTVTFIESTLGWQFAYFAVPVAIEANTLYVASLFMRSGLHLCTPNGYITAHVNGVIQGIADNAGGSNSILSLNATETFPTIAGGASNYWVDVGFIAS